MRPRPASTTHEVTISLSRTSAFLGLALTASAFGAPAVAHAETFSIEEQAACFNTAQPSETHEFAYELDVTTDAPAVAGQPLTASVQFAFPYAGDPGGADIWGGTEVPEHDLLVQAAGTTTRYTLPSLLAKGGPGMRVTPPQSVTFDVIDNHLNVAVAPFTVNQLGGHFPRNPFLAVEEFTIDPSTWSCTTSRAIQIPVTVPEPTPTPTPSVSPSPTPAPTTTYAGAASLRFLGGARGTATSRGSLTLPAPQPGGAENGAQLSVDPLIARVTASGLLPVVASMQLVQAGASLGTWGNGGLAITVPTQLKVASVRFLGLALVNGKSCQSPVFNLAVTGPAPSAPFTAVNGAGSLPGLRGCGTFNSALSSWFSGRFALALTGLAPVVPAA